MQRKLEKISKYVLKISKISQYHPYYSCLKIQILGTLKKIHQNLVADRLDVHSSYEFSLLPHETFPFEKNRPQFFSPFQRFFDHNESFL